MKTYMRLIMCAVLMFSFIGVMPAMIGVARGEVLLETMTAYDTLTAAEAGLDLILLDVALTAKMDAAKENLRAVKDPVYWRSDDPLRRWVSIKGGEAYVRLIEVGRKLEEVKEGLRLVHKDMDIPILDEDINYIYGAAKGIAELEGVIVGPDPQIPEDRKGLARKCLEKALADRAMGKYLEALDKYQQAWAAVATRLCALEYVKDAGKIFREMQPTSDLVVNAYLADLGAEVIKIEDPAIWKAPDEIFAEKQGFAFKAHLDISDIIAELLDHPLTPEDVKTIALGARGYILCSFIKIGETTMDEIVAEGRVPLARTTKAKDLIKEAKEKLSLNDYPGAVAILRRIPPVLGIR